MLGQEFRALFAVGPDAMIVVDESQHIVLVNEQAETVFGYTSSEMTGEPLSMLLPGRFRPQHPDHFRHFLEDDTTRRLMSDRGELSGLCKGGEEFPVEITIAKIPTEDGLLATAIIRDTTETRRMETALLERQSELEALVKSKDELIAAVSHEIRTPLTSIVGFARLLYDGAADLPADERREMVEILVQQSGDLTHVTEDLLAASKAEIGSLKVVQVSVDLRAQTAQVLETWQPRADQQARIENETVKCIGDPARVRQIVRNLLSNVSRYGGPEVHVNTGTRPEAAFVAVADNGRGIPEQDTEKIFEAYGRGSDVPGLAPSLGLGLYISRKLARLMQGDLIYQPHNGETVFELSLPPA